MAHGGGRVISTSLVLAVLLAASAATGWGVVAANPRTGVADDDGRGMMLATSRFLATAAARKTGRRTCRPGHPTGTCSSGAGAGSAGEHRHRFRCCSGVCTDVLASAGNCGACRKRCPFGRLCCAGRCAAVAYDAGNCGACGRACAAGTPCTYGMCGNA